MTVKHIMFYKVFHTDKQCELRYFDSMDQMKRAANDMLESFKFWGGGAVPVSIESYKIRKGGKYAGVIESKDYNPSLYMKYARENGNLYGYSKA